MLGAIIGDIIGSVYEWHNIKTTDFPLFQRRCRPTDDSVMTIAVAEGLVSSWGKGEEGIKKAVIQSMQAWGRKYPDAGYGESIYRERLRDRSGGGISARDGRTFWHIGSIRHPSYGKRRIRTSAGKMRL